MARRSAEGERLAQSILAQDARSIARQRHAPPPEPVESVDAGAVGQMLVDAREAGAAAANRAHLEQAVDAAQAKALIAEYSAITSGGSEVLHSVQRLLESGNRAGVDHLLATLQAESPAHRFEAEALAGAISQYEAEAAIDSAFAGQAAVAEATAIERAKVAEARPELASAAAAMERSALAGGESISPREAAARAQLLGVAERNAQLKAGIAGASVSIHREPEYKPSLRRELDRLVVGDESIDPVLGNRGARSRVVRNDPTHEVDKLRILTAGDSEALAADLHRARLAVAARDSDAVRQAGENARGVGRRSAEAMEPPVSWDGRRSGR